MRTYVFMVTKIAGGAYRLLIDGATEQGAKRRAVEIVDAKHAGIELDYSVPGDVQSFLTREDGIRS